MSVQVYGCNHVAIEDVFNLQKLDEGEGPCETSAAINALF